MNINKKNHNLATGAIIAALYVSLTYAQEMLFPGTASAAVQFRVSESLTVLALFTPAAIPGLTVGCAIANLLFMGALPLDVVLGSLATFLAAFCMYRLRNALLGGIPFAALVMPAIFNGVIIGLEIEIFFIEGSFNFMSFLLQGGCVALGELGVCFTLGVLLFKVIKNKKLEKYIK
ncbi:MAG: QueT transporter family protein [Ruminococcaceae bacterium]|nr:QueT transporter family protein [Oscillospiraceae bacterium]